jgi:hypothetical protein
MAGPLGMLLGLLTPSPVGAVTAAVGPNPYAPKLPGQQAIAADQVVSGALRGGLSGLTGSEADVQDEQISGQDLGNPLLRIVDGLTKRVPQWTSWYLPNLPDELVEGRGTGPTGAYEKGWIVLRREPWGATTRNRPKMIASTLLSPRDRAPLPADMATTYQDAHKGATRLEDMFGD